MVSTTTPKIAVIPERIGAHTNSGAMIGDALVRVTSRKISENTHSPKKNSVKFTMRSSANTTDCSHDAPNPTTEKPSAAAPNGSVPIASLTRPTSNPITAAVPGRTRTEATTTATRRKSGLRRLPRIGRSA